MQLTGYEFIHGLVHFSEYKCITDGIILSLDIDNPFIYDYRMACRRFVQTSYNATAIFNTPVLVYNEGYYEYLRLDRLYRLTYDLPIIHPTHPLDMREIFSFTKEDFSTKNINNFLLNHNRLPVFKDILFKQYPCKHIYQSNIYKIWTAVNWILSFSIDSILLYLCFILN